MPPRSAAESTAEIPTELQPVMRKTPRASRTSSASLRALPVEKKPKPAARPRSKPKAKRTRPPRKATRRVVAKGRAAGRRARVQVAKIWRGFSAKVRRRILLGALIATVLGPIWIINLTVAFVGHSLVFPLSPFFLREKVSALATYAAHRPFCLLRPHPDIAAEVATAEARYHLPRGLLAAVVQVESHGRPHRISPAGAMGVGQLMPSTARLYGVSDPFDTAQNLDGAARLLRDHLRRFHRLPLAIAAYNAGPAAVGHGIPQNGQTPEYVARVLRVYRASRPARPRVAQAE